MEKRCRTIIILCGMAVFVSSVSALDLNLSTSPSGILDVVDSLRTLIDLRLRHAKECHLPNSFYLNGSCFFRSFFGIENHNISSNNSSKSRILPVCSYHNAPIFCERMNGTLAVMDNPEEFVEVLNWITRSTNRSITHQQTRVRIIVGVTLQNGKLMWNNDRWVDHQKFAKFSYSYERGKRLECPVLDLSINGEELPMFITVRCDEKLPILCRKVVNRCHNNPCKRGRCLNYGQSFICQCPLMYSGRLCDRPSSEAVQTLIGIILILIGLAVTVYNWFKSRKDGHMQEEHVYANHCFQKSNTFKENYYCEDPLAAVGAGTSQNLRNAPKPLDQQPIFDEMNGYIPLAWTGSCLQSDGPLQCGAHHICCHHHRQVVAHNFEHKIEIKEKPKPKRQTVTDKNPSTTRRTIEILAGFISLLISISCCALIYQSRLAHQAAQINQTGLEQRRPNSLICSAFQHSWLRKVYKVPTTKLTIPSYGLLILLIFMMTRRKSHTWLCCGYGSIPVVFDPFSKINRFDSAAVFGILALEISHIFDEFIFHAYRYVSHGPLLDLLKQTGLVVLIGARYFPVLATLELNPPSAICFAFTACYMWMEVLMKAMHDAICPTDYYNRLLNHSSTLLQHAAAAGIKTNWTGSEVIARALRASKEEIRFNILKQFPYYAFSMFVACRLTCMSVLTTYDIVFPWLSRQLHRFKRRDYSFQKHVAVVQSTNSHWKERNYVQNLLRKQDGRNEPLWARLLSTCYDYHPHFACSKQIINIYAIAFTLVYYFTFWTLEQSHGIVDKVFRFIRFFFFYTFSQSLTEDKLAAFDNFRERLRSEVVKDLRIITSLTGVICLLQLSLGLKHYQRQMLRAYQGRFEEIPSRKKFKPGTLVAKALHYPGYMIGYLIWGYLFMLGTIFTLTLLVRNMLRFFDVFEYLAKWIVPMVILLLMKFLLISVLSRTAFTQGKGRALALRNTRCMFIFNYFNFFFDCFLGLIMCVSRISQASLAAVFLLSRLDYSMFGRTLERYDRGFASYACWLHLEEIQTHPVLIQFCQLVREKIVNRRMEVSSLHGRSVEKKLFAERRYVRRQLVAMRYALLITLTRNESLKKMRKHRLNQQTPPSIGFKKILTDTLKKFRSSTKCDNTVDVRYT